MKYPTLRLTGLATLLAASILSAQEAAKPAVDTSLTMIVNLQASPADIFAYGSWNGKIMPSKSGLVVLGAKGAQGDGGCGQKLLDRLDLNQASYFEVALATLPGNEVPKVAITFEDIDGTQYTAQVYVEQLLPGTPTWLRVKPNDFKPNGTQRGVDGLMDWTKIDRWHLQGDYVTKKPMAIAFIALRERR